MNPSRWGNALRCLLMVVMIQFAMPTTPLFANDDDNYLPGEVVIKLLQAGDLASVAADYQLEPLPLDQFGARPIYRMRILDGVDPQGKAAALAGDGRVQYAEPNFLEETPEGRQRFKWASGGSAGEYAEQWAGAKIGLAAAHGATRGAGVTVAVLDTGIDPNHSAFAGRLVPGYDFVNMDADPSEEGNPDQYLVYGHGTHVAGLVALAAPEAKIMPIRVLDAEGRGNIWVLAEALAYAVDPDGNPATNDGAQVINLSLSTRRPTNLLQEIIKAITCSSDDDDDDRNECLTPTGRGVVVVAAAGNRASDLPEYPAAEGVNGLLAVAASTANDTLATFSNYGGWVQVAAPGEQIIGPVPGENYGVWSGTSMAAPLVAGQAALVRAARPDWDAAAVTNEIIATAAEIGGVVPRRVDAAASLNVVSAHVLTITGTAANDEIQLQVGPTPGEVIVLKAPGVGGGARFADIATLVVASGGGDLDKVAIKAELTSNLSIKLDAGAGGDEVKLETKALSGVVTVRVDLVGASGHNKLEWLVDSAASALALALSVTTATGNDAVLLQVASFAPSERLALQLTANTRAGADKIETILNSAAATVDLAIATKTGTGNDQIKVELNQLAPAQVNTNFNIALDADNDNGHVILKGSTATKVVNGLINGGAHNDTLQLLVEGPATGSSVLDGGSEQDSCTATFGALQNCDGSSQEGMTTGAELYRAYLALVVK